VNKRKLKNDNEINKRPVSNADAISDFGILLSVLTLTGEKPCRKNTTVAANAIVTEFVRKRRVAPPAISHLPIAMPIPTVLSGGMSAVAMATPGRVADSLGCVIAYAAAIPPASAIIKSLGEGCVRETISLGISKKNDGKKGRFKLAKVIISDIVIESKAPRNKAEKEFFANDEFPIMDARPNPIIGDISGATNMAPIMTAGESVINPSVAMALERITSKKKSNFGEDASLISPINLRRREGGIGFMYFDNQKLSRSFFSIGRFYQIIWIAIYFDME